MQIISEKLRAIIDRKRNHHEVPSAQNFPSFGGTFIKIKKLYP